MRLYGLMITKDDQETFEDWCRDQLTLYDAVVCLDGSESEDTARIADLFGDRLIYLHERNFEIFNRTDHGLRNVAHAEIVRRFGVDNWIMCCHADEFCYHDPRKIAAMAESRGHDLVSWLTPHFYPHPSELPFWKDRVHLPVTAQFLHYHWSYLGDGWPWSEDRLYRNGSGVAWDRITHGSVRPVGIKRLAPFHPILRHYKISHVNLDNYEWDGTATRYRGHWEGQEHRTGLPFRVDCTEDLFVDAVPQYSRCDRFNGTFAHHWNIGEEFRPGHGPPGIGGNLAGKTPSAALGLDRDGQGARDGNVIAGLAEVQGQVDRGLVPVQSDSSDSSEESQLDYYHEARNLVARGLRVEAREAYGQIYGSSISFRLRALVANDLAVISVLEGDTVTARNTLLDAIMTDPGCEAAGINLALLRGDAWDANPSLKTGLHLPCSTGSEALSQSGAISHRESRVDQGTVSAVTTRPSPQPYCDTHDPRLSDPDLELSENTIATNVLDSTPNLVKPTPPQRSGPASSQIEGPAGAISIGQPPIKVAVVSFLFNWPTTGGGNVHTYELVQFLGRAGYEVRHIFARHLEWGIGKIEGELPYPSEVLVFGAEGWDLAQILERYRRAVEDFDPDCVILTDSWNIKPLLAEAVRGFPYILRLQALECLCPLNNVRLLSDDGISFRQCELNQLASPATCRNCLVQNGHTSGTLHQAERSLCAVGSAEYHELLTRSFAEAESVLVVNHLTEAIVTPHARDVRVVTAGMNADRFPWPQPQSTPIPGTEGITVIFFAGLVGELMKGFAVLHEACCKLWERRRDFVLVASSDPAGQVDEFTKFIGWQSQEELPRLLCAADIVAFPTIAQEALGRTAVEAMGAGRPVVASRIGGLPFTVVDGETGLLCNPGDPDDLAQKLETLIDNPALRERLGQAGRKRFEEHYIWDVIIARHYHPLLKRRDRDAAQLDTRPKPVVLPAQFKPYFPTWTDQNRLLTEAAQFFNLERGDVERCWRTYSVYHESKGYERRFGEFKTLCLEEAFILYLAMTIIRPRTIVEIGTQHGKSTRRILDAIELLGLETQVICFDVADVVEHFSPGYEAKLILSDVAGRFRRDVLDTYKPKLIFLDVHSHGLLREAINEVVANKTSCMLAVHDSGRGLCNPRMTIAKNDPAVTSRTGVWERHILAETFGIEDPLSEQLDSAESLTHRLAIFATMHGLGVIRPKATEL